jgi:hypothetical protein
MGWTSWTKTVVSSVVGGAKYKDKRCVHLPPPPPTRRSRRSRLTPQRATRHSDVGVKRTHVAGGGYTAMKKVANRNARFGTARQRKWPLNDGQIPNPNVARVALGTGYQRVEGNRRASRNGPVSDLPPEIP